MKLPNSKIYWTDYLSYSSMLTPDEICEVMKIVAFRAMCYNLPDNLPDNRQDNLPVSIQKQIQKLNKIQKEFYICLAKAQDESARDYMAKIMNGKKGGRPKKNKAENQDEKKEEIQPIYPPYFEKWLAYKKERKQKYTPIGVRQCLEKLHKMANWDADTAMRIVNQSIERGWSGLFPLKDEAMQIEENVSREEKQWKEWFEKNKSKETNNEHPN